MAIKDILLHLDNSASCQTRIDLAIQIAKSHGAHIKGLYVLSHSYYAPRHIGGEAAAAKITEAAFVDKCLAAGVSAEWLYVDWSVVGVGITEIVTLYAYYTDLVIVGQPTQESHGAGLPFDLPERLGLGAGKPLLIVPYAGTFATKVERIMIAWKAGRESSRTVGDAMPFLTKAAHVSVVTVKSPGEELGSADNDFNKLEEYLSRHQVSPRLDQILAPPLFPVGDILLNHACEQKMDLLVMGAFASSRRGSFMFGPVARHLMNHMTLPVLISH